MNTKNRESGQAIVIIAFALIVLLAFAALAIDGGMVFSDRRRAQNATDAGSLAGGGAAALSLANEHVMNSDFECGSTEVNGAITQAENAAQNLMEANHYNAADYTVQVVCQDEDPTKFEELYLDVITNIITETETSFVHLVWDGIVKNNVQATTRVKPKTAFAYGQAVVGLNNNQDCDNASAGGVKFTGSGDVTIKGGGVWANGCIAAGGSCSVEVIGGGISSGNGNFGTCPSMDPLPIVEDDVLPEDSYYVPTPNCGASGAVTIDDIRLTNAAAYLDLNAAYPGVSLICLTNSGNALVMNNGTLVGDGFTIYNQNGGDISISGGTVNLSAPGDPNTEPGLPGVLFYIEPVSSGPFSDVTINGNGASTLKGLIYGPTTNVTMSGTSDTETCGDVPEEECGPTFSTQIVAWNVEIAGGATIDINYNDTWTYPPQAKINLQE